MEDLLQKLGVYNSEKLLKAFNIAKIAHEGTFRKSIKDKVEYIIHPLTVALYVKEYKYSCNNIDICCAAILHDVVEDTSITLDEIEAMFGLTVREIVSEVTTIKDECKKIGKANYLLQKMVHMSNYSLVLKLADRLDNVNDLFDFINFGTEKDKKFALKYIKETRFILDNLHIQRMLTETQQNIFNRIMNKINFL